MRCFRRYDVYDKSGRVIVQKDLGADTPKVVGEIAEYNPDATLQEVDD
jgi:hypothetical protein